MKLTDREVLELGELVNSAVDGRLTRSQRDRLQQWLGESQAARQFYVRFMGMSADLSLAAAESLAEGAELAPAVGDERRVAGGLFRLVDQARRWPWRYASIGATIGAALCLAVLGGWTYLNRPAITYLDESAVETGPDSTASSQGVAVLTHAAGLVLANTNSAGLEVGSSLSPGWLRLKAGVAQIRFDDGAQVIVEAPAELKLVSSQAARLRFGKLSAQVPVPARGFKVRSAGVEVTDLGTEFGLSKPLGEPLEVQVFTGRVEFAVADTNVPVRQLATGQGVRIAPKRLRQVRANRKAFVSATELGQRETSELRARYDGWKQEDGALDHDPAMLVHFNFEDRRRAGRVVANRDASPLAGTQGNVIGCRWVEGRWPGKGAVEFRGRNDRVQLKVPGTFKSLTYLAWVRVDSLPNSHNGLALTDRNKPGEVHWRIRHDGRLEISARFLVSGKETDWERLSSRPIVTTGMLGHWMHLAAVYDGPGKIMALYANGQLVAARPIEEPLSLTLDAVELGNWARQPNPSAGPGDSGDLSIRDFHGRMDEFALLSRPLSAEEIHRQYELGRRREPMILAELPKQSPSATR